MASNLPQILIFLGISLLAIEVVVLGFASFILFFIGLGCLLTGLLIFIGLLPESIVSALISVAVLTFAAALGLWKPLNKMQDKVEHKAVQGDFIGHRFVLDSDVSPSQKGMHRYSGIEWQIKSSEALPAGTEVEVIAMAVGEFTVKAKA